jgi:Uma2 family endonuclease
MSTTTLLTFEEFEKLPDEAGKLELLDGELIRMPPPKKRHMTIAHRLLFVLKPVVDSAPAEARLGGVFVEMGYKIGAENWLRPDVSIEHSGQPCDEYLEGAPALAVEVVSESNTARDLERKQKLYLDNGGIEVWVIYPDTQTVYVYRTDNVQKFSGILRSRLIEGLEIDLKTLFAA